MEEIKRENPFCVISKGVFGEIHDIQTNNTWSENPYEGYAVVPDEMVPGIVATRGYCDIVLTGDGSAVASYTAREIPDTSHIDEIMAEIAELKAKLAETDYQAIKYAEGWIDDAEYAPIKGQRQAWRDRINELEAELSK